METSSSLPAKPRGVVRILAYSVLFCLTAAMPAATPETVTNVFESLIPPSAQSEVDRLVFTQLERLGIQPVLCSDAVFVRRVYLDVLGTLPTGREARDFIQDTDPGKRQRLIDGLLEREEFADYWAMKWGDILRIKAEFPVNLWPNAAQAYHRWVRASLAANKPYDQFVRELLTSSGSNFRVGQVNFYRAIQNRTPEGITRAVALAFMGARAETWPSNRLAGMSVFFSQVGYKPTSEWKEEHVFWDPVRSSAAPGNSAPGAASIAALADPTNASAGISLEMPTNRPSLEATFPDGMAVTLPSDRDPREIFADWLITPRNPWFTRSIVNRVWGWFLGRGIIHEPDDIREDNPPANPALLACLEREMVAGHYDLKRFYRLVLSSQTYQLSSVRRLNTPEAAANFASYPLRRLEAEVLSDAINKVTGSSDLYTSPIPEPFTYIPRGMPAVAIADGSITSPFLALFGRSARATGLESERNNKPTPSQWLYLLNSTEIQRKLEQGPRLQAILGSGLKPPQLLEELYLAILSRFPTPEEVEIAATYGQARPPQRKPVGSTNAAAGTGIPAATNSVIPTSSSTPTNAGPTNSSTGAGEVAQRPRIAGQFLPKRRDDWVDIAWSLINSEEFLYRH